MAENIEPTFPRPNIFVPDNGNQRDTAIVLVAVAEKHDLDQRSIVVAPGGFYVTQEIADALDAEGGQVDTGDKITREDVVPEDRDVQENVDKSTTRRRTRKAADTTPSTDNNEE